jgi:hypothetical protein
MMALLLAGAVAFGVYNYRQAQGRPGIVTLFAHGGAAVRMVESMFADANVVRVFPSNTQCAYVEGPLQTENSGAPISFYKLTCDNTTGWIEKQFVH